MQLVPSKRLKLSRRSRLKLGCDFKRVRLEGRRVAVGCLLLNWLVPGPAGHARVGVVVSNKLGSAVVRSRARRLLREAFRLHQYDLVGPVDLVLVARPSIVGKKFAEVERDFLAALDKAGLLKTGIEEGLGVDESAD